MNDNLPSPQMALKLLARSGCSRKVIEHCKTVSSLAMQIADVCEKKGLQVNTKLVEIGALLHDIGRSRTHDVHHVIRGAEIARSLRLPESVVAIIERHGGGGIAIDEAISLGWPPKNYIPKTLEEKIVAYADKIVEGLQRVPIERTIKKYSTELGDNHPSIRRMQKLHQEFSTLLES